MADHGEPAALGGTAIKPKGWDRYTNYIQGYRKNIRL